MLEEIRKFIEEYQMEYKKAPSIRTICNRFDGFFKKSINKCQRYIKALSDRNQIGYAEGEGIKLNPVLLSGKTVKVPLVGTVACGAPILAVENIESMVDLPAEIFGSAEHYMLRAKGNSMVDAGIYDGDYMVVKCANTARYGEIVIALMGDEATAKIFMPNKDYIVLRAANNSTRRGERIYKDIITTDCAILGIVDNVIHKPSYRI